MSELTLENCLDPCCIRCNLIGWEGTWVSIGTWMAYWDYHLMDDWPLVKYEDSLFQFRIGSSKVT
jgi:hypothetical protein